MDWAVVIFREFGIPVGVLVVVIYLFILEKRSSMTQVNYHREERKAWQESNEKSQERSTEALNSLRESNERWQDRNVSALEELTKVLKTK